MRILVFSTQHVKTGGIESHLKEFCLQLVQSGVEIDLLVTKSNMTSEVESFYRNICRKVFLGKKKNPILKFTWLLSVLSVIRLYKYNAIYTNGQGESIRFITSLIRKNSWWVHHHHTAGDTADQTHWGKHYWKTLRTTNRVIACSKINAGFMESALNRSVDSIPCFSRAIQSNPDKTSINNRRIRLGYYGRLIPEKGIDTLCQLSNDSDLNNIEFHIWGEGSAYSSDYFDHFPNMTYHGSFDGLDQLTQVIHTIDGLLLLTTNAEGLPIILLESMSAGLPWLSTNRGGIPDIALDIAANRIIPSTSNYEQIKVAVLNMANDLKLGRISGQQQIALYNRKFSANVLVKQWRNMLNLDTSIVAKV